MFQSPVEIANAVTTFFSNRSTLVTRWDNDLELFRQKAYDAGKGYYSYTSNSPRNLADKVISYISGSELVIRIPSDKLLEEERKTAANVERYLYGSFNLADEQMAMIDEPTIRDQMGWMSVIHGGFAIRVFVNKDTENNTKPELSVWDLRDTAFGRGSRGLIWAAHIYKASKEAIKDEFGIDITEEEAEIIDFWDKEKNSIVLGGNAFAQAPEAHGLSYCPVFLFRVGTTPSVRSMQYADTYALRGESVFAPNRNLYPLMNKTMSDALTLVRRGVKPPIAIYSHDGKATLEADIFTVDKTNTVSLQIGERIEPILPPSMPVDSRFLVEVLFGEVQRGGMPHTEFGELAQRLSGFAIQSLRAAVFTIVAPFLDNVERGYRIACRELLKQFNEGFASVKVQGKDSRGQQFGYPRLIEIAPKDINQAWLPEVLLIPQLPKDDAQKYYLANLARQPNARGEPLLSDDTLREETLGIKDTELEKDKLMEEWGNTLPLLRLQRLFRSLIDRGQFADAQSVLTELQGALGQGQPPPTDPRTPKSPTELEQQATGIPGLGMPPENMAGLPPEVLPSEMMGGLPGGATNAGLPNEER